MREGKGRVTRVQFPVFLIFGLVLACYCNASEEQTLSLDEIKEEAASFQVELGDSGNFTFWFPSEPDELVLPISAGIVVDKSQSSLMGWLREHSPWELVELPVLGLRYGEQLVIVIAPWPHYAKLVIEDRVGVRFSLPPGRHDVAPVEIVAMRRQTEDPLEVARQFRGWRKNSPTTGVIPRQRPLQDKVGDLKKVERLFGAPHCYLWGPSVFSRHDVRKDRWQQFTKSLIDAPHESFVGTMVALFSGEQRKALQNLGAARNPVTHLANQVSLAIDEALLNRELLHLSRELSAAEVIDRNRQAFAIALAKYVNSPETWGDGLSKSMLDQLQKSGIDRALLVLGSLSARSPRPEVTSYAEKLGYLIGPYDSYHSIHSPQASNTWTTAQFDLAAYEQGRVINADGSGNAGFLGRGFHFSPRAAWPYVQKRVGGILSQTTYSTWFIDCDATAECFEDFNPQHPATKSEDAEARRHRLKWLESEHQMVVGSEAGSVLFADVVHYGHGVHTPYIGHLDPSFRDQYSPHFLGPYWPSDMPEKFFRPATVPPSIYSPYFDPTVRIPLYQAALGDELIATHHWIFGSAKFTDIKQTRELLEILYMVPPMYHLNRETWPKQRGQILRHLRFWSPLHRELAPAPLIAFECLTKDRLVQRTTFKAPRGEVSITVNFGKQSQTGCPPLSAVISGAVNTTERTYSVLQ